MKTENIDEVEQLIIKYRKVMAAKSSINEITGENGGLEEKFTLVDKDTKVEIKLHLLKAEIMDSIVSVLNDQYDKIMARLKLL